MTLVDGRVERRQLVVLAGVDRLDCLLDGAAERVRELVKGRGTTQLDGQPLGVTPYRQHSLLEITRDVNRPPPSRK